jgi:hypothetical protein
MKSTRASGFNQAHSGTINHIECIDRRRQKMDANTNAHFYAWIEDGELPPDTSVPVSHRSSQVSAEPDYVTEICGRFAGEKSEEEQKSCVIRGYN